MEIDEIVHVSVKESVFVVTSVPQVTEAGYPPEVAMYSTATGGEKISGGSPRILKSTTTTDMRIDKTVVLEKMTYLAIVLFTVFFIFMGAHDYFPIPKSIYLTVINLLLGIKVACGFFIVFYRFIAYERS